MTSKFFTAIRKDVFGDMAFISVGLIVGIVIKFMV